MPVRFPCPGCRAAIEVGNDLIGKAIRCTDCHTVTIVPVEERLTELPAPPRRQRVEEEEDDFEPPHLRRPDRPQSSGWIVAVVIFGLLLVTFLVCAGLMGFMFL